MPPLFLPPDIEATPYVKPPVLSRFVDRRTSGVLSASYAALALSGSAPVADEWDWQDKAAPRPTESARVRLKTIRRIVPRIVAAAGEFSFDEEDE